MRFGNKLLKSVKPSDPNSLSYAAIKQNLTVHKQLPTRENKTIYAIAKNDKNTAKMIKMWNTISEIIHMQKNNDISIKNTRVQEIRCIYDQAGFANIFNNFCTNIDLKVIKTRYKRNKHYCDVIMGAMASQITSLTVVYSTVDSGPDQRKHQSSASLDFVRGLQR